LGLTRILLERVNVSEDKPEYSAEQVNGKVSSRLWAQSLFHDKEKQKISWQAIREMDH
jgi:hypothetical protein